MSDRDTDNWIAEQYAKDIRMQETMKAAIDLLENWSDIVANHFSGKATPRELEAEKQYQQAIRVLEAAGKVDKKISIEVFKIARSKMGIHKDIVTSIINLLEALPEKGE